MANLMTREDYDKMGKDPLTEVLLSFFLGGVGAHKFYMGKTGMGVLYIFIAGLFGIGSLVDFIRLLVNYLNMGKYPQALPVGSPVDSAADELKKYKELLDSGVITESEYNSKKAQLLKMM